MNKRLPYTYTILRYRPDAVSGEFVNVGVLLHSPKHHFLKLKTRSSMGGRISKMFPGVSGNSFRSYMALINREAGKKLKFESSSMLSLESNASNFAKLISKIDDSSFVWSSVSSGLTEDPDFAIEKIFNRYVAKFDSLDRSGRTDADIWRPVKDLLNSKQLTGRLQSKVIESDFDQVEFDHAWKNGKWHCYQPVSFDLVTEDSIRDKAARWVGHLWALREAHDDFEPYFLVGAPSNENLRPVYNRAVEMLKSSEGSPNVFTEEDVPDLVNEIEDQIRRHDGALV